MPLISWSWAHCIIMLMCWHRDVNMFLLFLIVKHRILSAQEKECLCLLWSIKCKSYVYIYIYIYIYIYFCQLKKRRTHFIYVINHKSQYLCKHFPLKLINSSTKAHPSTLYRWSDSSPSPSITSQTKDLFFCITKICYFGGLSEIKVISTFLQTAMGNVSLWLTGINLWR